MLAVCDAPSEEFHSFACSSELQVLRIISQVRAYIEDRLQIQVQQGDALGPNEEGTFDGLTITLNPKLLPTEELFCLLHLIGHTVQVVSPSLASDLAPLNTARTAYERTGGDTNSVEFNDYLRELEQYERAANDYGGTVLAACGGKSLLHWYGQTCAADWAMTVAWHRSGQSYVGAIEDFMDVEPWQVSPKPIPPMSPRLVEGSIAIADLSGR